MVVWLTVCSVEDDEGVVERVVQLDVGRDPDPVTELNFRRVDQSIILQDGVAGSINHSC